MNFQVALNVLNISTTIHNLFFECFYFIPSDQQQIAFNDLRWIYIIKNTIHMQTGVVRMCCSFFGSILALL